jgi:NTP pyrophosphatase (non-canonical NTP hydrolase)
MIVELGEFIQALGWKPWRNDNRDHSQEKVLDEFADILAFLGVLITILQSHGITIDDIADAYIDKIVVNMNRFIGKLEEDQSDINRESS